MGFLEVALAPLTFVAINRAGVVLLGGSDARPPCRTCMWTRHTTGLQTTPPRSFACMARADTDSPSRLTSVAILCSWL